MFTGIVENLGQVVNLKRENTNLHITVKSTLAPELKIDQSVAHNGVCLTVVKIEGDLYTVTAINETLEKTNIGDLKTNDIVNLERCLAFGDRVDGHMVYGHVDTVGMSQEILEQDGSTVFTFSFPKEFSNLVVEKGSISLNGTSLTVFDVTETMFSVAVIPYTLENTSIKNLALGDKVNLEFDIFGKYIDKYFKNIK